MTKFRSIARVAQSLSLLAIALLLVACQAPTEPGARGTLEYPRIDLRADSAETLIELHVMEGDSVSQGDPIARLDDRRAQAILAAAEAGVVAAEQRLEELVNGTRSETLRAARAEREAARVRQADAERERNRVQELARQKLLPMAELDRAQAVLEQAQANLSAVQARLDELLAGTRDEQLRQAQAQLKLSRADAELKRLNLQRLTLIATADGRIESVPFEVGERVPANAVIATQQVGRRPHARVFLPMQERQQVQPGEAYQVFVRGQERAWQGRLRWVASEPSFTPYYALSGDDADRLVYLAEIDLTEEAAGQLPAGLPLRTLRSTAAAQP
ncbi:HlyD family secretion protein [Pseudomarimonas arenosa]|uniref:HlyD family efflux transporter periplasmic adaptor subunit n=1 Tax=Pseudomarimonas arenosa TaxID=2774145 RepID=A0AAW3ZKN4_9GAMM|nr:HlyD family efflux transporter periplasmic adaptor subunit [Pseudomarimonas arenosa]MBD8525254.1 HlyD family efflux transporter periplasmic adaptor subunit [Pseudomarimonas arenosa]